MIGYIEEIRNSDYQQKAVFFIPSLRGFKNLEVLNRNFL